VNPTPLLGFFSLGGQKFAGTSVGTISLGNNTAGLPNHSQDRPTTPMIEISTLKRRDHINSEKPTVKQARQDLNRHFHSNEIHVFYSEKFFNVYLITSKKSNTNLHYTSVFTFLKRNTDDHDLIPTSCHYG